MHAYPPDRLWCRSLGVALLALLLGAHAPWIGAQGVVAPPATNNVAAIGREQALREAWRQAADPNALPVENMTLPVAHHPDGRVRALLKAGKALIPAVDSGYVRAQDVVVEIFDNAGHLEGIFITDNCFFDRATSDGYCEGKVRIEQRGVRIFGVDMVWNLETRRAKILSQAEVRLNRFMEGIGEAFK
jgi:hypothetical protein